MGFSDESIENIPTSDTNFAESLINYYSLPDVKLNGLCLINDNDSSLGAVNLLYTRSMVKRIRHRFYIR